MSTTRSVSRPLDFDDLVRREAAGIHATAWRLLRDDAAAADVTQQVFVRLLRDPTALPEEPEARRARLRWLAAKLACNELRSLRRRGRREAEHAHRRTMDHPETDPADTEERRAVARSLAALPDDQRVPLVLRYHEGLTLAGIAGVLGCAESTAHERIRRGLAALRVRLEGLGFAAGAARLDALLPECATPVALPAGLQTELLALPSTAAVAVVGPALVGGAKLTVAALLASAAVAVAVWAPWRALPSVDAPAEVAAGAAVERRAPRDAAPGRDRSPDRVAVAVVTDAGAALAAPPESAAAVPDATVRGTLRDAATGMPLAAARVSLQSVRSEGKMPLHASAVTTAADGRFEAIVPAYHAADAEPRALRYRATFGAESHRSAWTEPFAVVADGVVDLGVRELAPVADDVAAPWRTAVEVVGPDGMPVAGAIVAVFRRGGADAPDARIHETGGRAGADGRIELAGSHHGDKLVWIRPLRSPLAPRCIAVTIAETAPAPLRVALGVGAVIRGTLRAAEDGRPVAGMWLAAQSTSDPDHVVHVESDADGRFEFAGLAGDTFTVESTLTPPWSPLRIDDVAAGEADLRLLVKDLRDTTPRGHFVGEIHGRVVDAATGAPRPILGHQLHDYWLDPSESDWRARVAAMLFRPVPVQTAMPMPSQRQAAGDGAADGGTTQRIEHPTDGFHRSFARDGRYVLVVRVADGVGIAGPFDVAPGVLHRDVAVAVEPLVRVEGRVVDSAGRPVRDARVWLAGVDPAADAERASLHERLAADGALGYGPQPSTGADGRFVLDGAAPDFDLRVHAMHGERGHGASTTFVVRRGAPRPAVDVVIGR